MKPINLVKNYSVRAHPLIYIVAPAIIGIVVLSGYSMYLGFIDEKYISGSLTPWERGSFWGGHLGAIASSITLLVVIISTSMQANADRASRLRESFLQGIGHIASYDIKEPGCEQALRLLDFYSMIAIQLDDNELYLILNTVMTGKIRKTLDETDGIHKENFINAKEARKKIGVLLSRHYGTVK